MNEIRYCSVQQVIEDKKYPFTMGMLRSLLINREKNGLTCCVRKIGKRLYIRMDLFDNWIDAHGKQEDLEGLDKKIKDKR